MQGTAIFPLPPGTQSRMVIPACFNLRQRWFSSTLHIHTSASPTASGLALSISRYTKRDRWENKETNRSFSPHVRALRWFTRDLHPWLPLHPVGFFSWLIYIMQHAMAVHGMTRITLESLKRRVRPLRQREKNITIVDGSGGQLDAVASSGGTRPKRPARRSMTACDTCRKLWSRPTQSLMHAVTFFTKMRCRHFSFFVMLLLTLIFFFFWFCDSRGRRCIE